MEKRSKILKLSAAVAALVGPGVVGANADATTTEPSHNTTPGTAPDASVKIRAGTDFMSFTVSGNASGEVIAQHESHASHASHESHASHASHSSGM